MISNLLTTIPALRPSRLLIALLLAFSLVSVGYANKGHHPGTRINMTLEAERWVKTTTAQVDVNVNASLAADQLKGLQTKLVSSLKRLIPEDWQVVGFNQSQAASGLSNISAQLTSRLTQEQIAKLSKDLGKLQSDGINYTLGTVDFSPSLTDLQQARQQLRSQLYKEAKQALARANQQLTPLKFSIKAIRFSDSAQPAPAPRPMMFSRAAETAGADNPGVSRKLKLYANLVLASESAKKP
jgi:uncharacterized protein YggE